MSTTTSTPFTLDLAESARFRGLALRDGAAAVEGVLHVRAAGDVLGVAAVVLPDVEFVGSIVGGDSWAEWCEPADGGDRALHVDLVADGEQQLLERARLLCDALGVTTAHDAVLTSPVWSDGAREVLA